MRRDIANWCKSCLLCQQSKVTRHTQAPIRPLPAASPFSVIHADLVGPLPPSAGHKYLLTIIDRGTRWFKVIPLRDITTKGVIEKLTFHWISRYGVPHELVTDRVSQFMSLDFANLLRQMGIKHRPTTSYNPQCNGLVERLHRVLKESLRCQLNASWYNQLPLILLSLRNAYSRSTGTSPAKTVFRTPLRLPAEIFTPMCTDQPAPCTSPSYKQSNIFVPAALAEASHVWLRQEIKHSSLQRPYSGPYDVLARTDKTFTLRINNTETLSLLIV